MKTIMVFRTSISKKKEIKKIQPLLNQLMDSNGYWNFDLEDWDNILRVETQLLKSNQVIDQLNNEGFRCEELF